MNKNLLFFFLNDYLGCKVNLIETNVLNIALVLIILVVYLGNTLKKVLINRKENVFFNFKQIEQLLLERHKLFNQATIQLNEAKTEIKNIRKQTLFLIKKEKEKIQFDFFEKNKQLKKIQEEIFHIEEKKIQKKFTEFLVDFSLNKINKKLKKLLNYSNQKSLNNFKIGLFVNYKKK
uniref:ATP synthase CF0 subunit B n=1 Tax=Prototheca miyajii TaxID=2034260 RepID=UPI0030025388